MLKHLSIQNVILVESAEIDFERALNVLTGETGSGKSAIMEAIRILMGEKADISIIRQGCDKGVVIAAFDISNNLQLRSLLDAAGISYDSNEDLLIRREISISGKSRCYINDQMVQLTLLRSVGKLLIDIVAQHANQRLQNIENHRTMVDTFGRLHDLAEDFRQTWEKENALKKDIEELVSSEAKRLRDIEICKMECEELAEARLKEGEEETLFAQYTLLSNAQERAEKGCEVLQALQGDRVSIIGLLTKYKHSFEELVRIDPTLKDGLQSYNNALIELKEVFHTLQRYCNHIENHPQKVTQINDRLTLINKLKRKYGNTIEQIQGYQQEISQKLESLENADSKIEALKEQLAVVSSTCQALAERLTRERKIAAELFADAIAVELRSLNMPRVEFKVMVEPQKRSSQGDDRLEFFLAPNIGEGLIAVRECASGGELSRLLLAIQTVLAGKDRIPILIFDEIDGNIGGQTAVIVGEKLASIAKSHQVLCITHFSQVASKGSHHLYICKREREGRTVTLVEALDALGRKKELKRMQGVGAEVLKS